MCWLVRSRKKSATKMHKWCTQATDPTKKPTKKRLLIQWFGRKNTVSAQCVGWFCPGKKQRNQDVQIIYTGTDPTKKPKKKDCRYSDFGVKNTVAAQCVGWFDPGKKTQPRSVLLVMRICKRFDVDVSWINYSSKTQAQVVSKAQTCRAASIDLYIYIIDWWSSCFVGWCGWVNGLMWTCHGSIFHPKPKLRWIVKRKRAAQHLSIYISIYNWLMVVLFCGVSIYIYM